MLMDYEATIKFPVLDINHDQINIVKVIHDGRSECLSHRKLTNPYIHGYRAPQHLAIINQLDFSITCNQPVSNTLS